MMYVLETTFTKGFRELPVQVLVEWDCGAWLFNGVLREDGEPVSPRVLRLITNSVAFMRHVDCLIEKLEDPYADR